MINRDLIRIKAVQLTYAYFQNGNYNDDPNKVNVAEEEFLFSLSKAYHMYNYLLELLVALTNVARKRYEVALTRAKRGDGQMPSDKFINNRLALMLESNKMLSSFYEKKTHIWTDSIEYVTKLMVQIEQSEVYNEYISSDEDSFEADREVWRKIYRQFIQENEDLDSIFEEASLYWNDDKEIVDTFVLKTIKRFTETSDADQELLFEYKDAEDREFARKLFRAGIMNMEEYQRYMSEASRNWDFSRLAYMDVIIMQLAIAEMMNFPGIPVNVTINEYVELAKLYSTPRSGGYINGMLDAIARHLIDNGKLLKTMPAKQRRES